MSRWLGMLAMITACGTVADPPAGPDAALPGDGGIDSSSDGAPGDGPAPLGPWSAPRRIAELSVAGFVDQYPSVRGDGRELYFASNRDGGTQDVYVSTRFATSEPWGAPRKVTEIEGGSTETGPDVSDDGRTLFFSRAVSGSGTGFDIYVATRPDPSALWDNVAVVPELSTAATEISPHVSGDGKTMYFTRGSGGALDIMVATRASETAPWQNVRLLNRFNGATDDNDVTTTADDQEAIFESDRDGALALFASRRNTDGVFGVPAKIDELAGGFRADITADGRYMVLTINGPDGTSDLFESTRQ
jgi:Tol biopolymer transport system component